jgi:hypothetical protein
VSEPTEREFLEGLRPEDQAAVTPVEERIDHEEQRRLANVAAEAALNELGWEEASHDEVQAFLTGYRVAYLALPTERSACEDLEQTLWDVLEWDDGDGHPHPPSMFRLAKRHIRERHRTLNGRPTSIHDRSLPATEPAQPETVECPRCNSETTERELTYSGCPACREPAQPEEDT